MSCATNALKKFINKDEISMRLTGLVDKQDTYKPYIYTVKVGLSQLT